VATHQRRGATEHVYAAREHPRFSDSAWAATSPLAKHAMVSAVLSQIGEYATQSAAAGGFDRSDAHFTRSALRLDEKGFTDLAKVTKSWLAQMQKIESQAASRLEKAGEDGFDAGLVILMFEALPFFEAARDGDGRGSPKRRRGRSRATTASV
jgi:hypothetical protein